MGRLDDDVLRGHAIGDDESQPTAQGGAVLFRLLIACLHSHLGVTSMQPLFPISQKLVDERQRTLISIKQARRAMAEHDPKCTTMDRVAAQD